MRSYAVDLSKPARDLTAAETPARGATELDELLATLAEAQSPRLSMTGDEQEKWLVDGLRRQIVSSIEVAGPTTFYVVKKFSLHGRKVEHEDEEEFLHK